MVETYNQMFHQNKLNLIYKLEKVCNEINENIGDEVKVADEEAETNTVIYFDDEKITSSYKLYGKLIINTLVMIDYIDNTCTVDNLKETFPNAFKVLGVSKYSFNDWPLNEFLRNTKTYQERWKELKGILVRLLENESAYTGFDKNSIIDFVNEQVEYMNHLETDFEIG